MVLQSILLERACRGAAAQARKQDAVLACSAVGMHTINRRQVFLWTAPLRSFNARLPETFLPQPYSDAAPYSEESSWHT